MSHKICMRNVERDTFLAEVREILEDSIVFFEAIGAPELREENITHLVMMKMAEVSKRTIRPIAVCIMCGHRRYTEGDAKCTCHPALDKDKNPRVVGFYNRHYIRAQERNTKRLMKKLKRYPTLVEPTVIPVPVHSEKWKDEAQKHLTDLGLLQPTDSQPVRHINPIDSETLLQKESK